MGENFPEFRISAAICDNIILENCPTIVPRHPGTSCVAHVIAPTCGNSLETTEIVYSLECMVRSRGLVHFFTFTDCVLPKAGNPSNVSGYGEVGSHNPQHFSTKI